MDKLKDIIELYKEKKIRNMKPLKWKISLNESGNRKAFDINLEVNSDYRFQYKYHNVLDLRNSNVHIPNEGTGSYPLDYMINVFVDLLNGEVQQYVLTPDVHGLISLNKGEGVKANGLIQLFDYNSNSCLCAQKTQGIIISEENN